MLLIIAYHYVVNSGLREKIEVEPFSYSSIGILLIGSWGKMGINCFVLITGYFMCKSHITGHKLLKLYLQLVFYAVIIYFIFCLTGHEQLSAVRIISLFNPIKRIDTHFVSAFLIFYLLIPFLTILVNNLSKRMHGRLILILLVIYTLLPSFDFNTSYNYVSWFGVLFLISSYIRFYEEDLRISHRKWGYLTLATFITGCVSIAGFYVLNKCGVMSTWRIYQFVADSNKILALAIAFTSFMWFKDLRIPHSRLINIMGAATFGVLIIHGNSDAMRQWLWQETIDPMGHLDPSALFTFIYAIVSVLIIFIVCCGIDWFRSRYIEPHYMKYVSKALKGVYNRFIRLGKESASPK